ncbi:hypothetical protein BDZ45DRAFT_724430 [Acephala macrosclerotiorum]|nr:hypothetical protein BDZ45DRAFT_724430 [Acephala macrosclerotiorum]
MTTPSATHSTMPSAEGEDETSCIHRITALKDDELSMIFALLPRNALTNVARVCKRWNKISTPQINLLVEFVFSIGSQQRNHSLLQSLLNKSSTVARQIRVIKIKDWPPPSGVEIERGKEFDVVEIGDEDSEQALQPLAQLHQLIWLIPNLPLSKFIYSLQMGWKTDNPYYSLAHGVTAVLLRL